jgi:hypothetical protein
MVRSLDQQVALHRQPVRCCDSVGPVAHAGVARDALLLHVDVQRPWLNQLKDAGYTTQALAPFGSIVAPQFPENPFDVHAIWAVNAALTVQATWTESHTGMARSDSVVHQAVVDILWNAYFGQAKTEAEKQALLHTVQEKYKITVIDPDFFHAEIAN